MSYLPRGCDQQGRYPEAAEACTELGVDPPENCPVSAVLSDAVIAVLILAVIGIIVMGLL